MSNPVNNEGISAKVNLGGLKVNLNIGGSTRVSNNQSENIFRQVNQNLVRNPNHSRTHSPDAPPPAQPNETNLPTENHGDNSPPARNQRSNNNGNSNGTNHGQNALNHASEQGLLNGQGHHKTVRQATNQTTPPPTNTTPPPTNAETAETNLPNTTVNPPRNPVNNGGRGPIANSYNHNTQIYTPPDMADPLLNQPHQDVNFPVNLDLRINRNLPNGLLRNVFNQVLRQNDIYLSHNTVNRIITNRTFQTSGPNFNQTQLSLPREINNLVQIIGSRVLSLLDNSQHLNGKRIHQVSAEISRQLQAEIQAAKTVFLNNTDLGAKHFKHLNIQEKMQTAVELMPRHLPAKAVENLQNYSTREILSGLLLARGLVVPGERAADVRNLIAFRPSVLPHEVSLAALRDVGQLVRILISETAGAKTTANLDLAVQKFIRILIANNELGVLLAAVNLTGQIQDRGGLISRSLALVQIYELINRLLLAGEKAMKQALPEVAAKLVQPKAERSGFPLVNASGLADTDETNSQLYKLHATGAESSLRQFLEFNPAFAFDNSASAFNNPDDAREAQRDFVNLYHDDIEAWLQSGNHRFVKDIDFEKPVGIIVERSSDYLFTASKARIVLVRDSSVQGWHFLKSFLVK